MFFAQTRVIQRFDWSLARKLCTMSFPLNGGIVPYKFGYNTGVFPFQKQREKSRSILQGGS